MTQDENIKELFDDMKYGAGAGERHNAAIEYHVRNGIKQFELEDRSYVDGQLVRHQLHFNFGKSKKTGDRHFYNGTHSTYFMIDLPEGKIGGVSIPKLEAFLQAKPVMNYALPPDRILEDHQLKMDAYDRQMQPMLQQVAAADPRVFNQIMVMYSPNILFAQDASWQAAQKEIRKASMLQHFFTAKKRATLLEIPNLFKGRPVCKEYLNDRSEKYWSWIALDLTQKKKDNDNYEWLYAPAFDLEAKIDGFTFYALENTEVRDELLWNLRKGFLVELSGPAKDGGEYNVIGGIDIHKGKAIFNLYGNDGKWLSQEPYLKTPKVYRKSSVQQLGRNPASNPGEGTAPSPGVSATASSEKETDGPGESRQQPTANRHDVWKHSPRHSPGNSRSTPMVMKTRQVNKQKNHGIG